MNLNPLFWVNELKEIGQRMKATGPINGILWCITLARHSTRPLCAFCLYPLCYSLIILSGVRVRVANCADRLSLRMAKDSPNTDTPPDCAQPPWIMPIIPILWFFSPPSLCSIIVLSCISCPPLPPPRPSDFHSSVSITWISQTHTHTHTQGNKYIVFWQGSWVSEVDWGQVRSCWVKAADNCHISVDLSSVSCLNGVTPDINVALLLCF